MSKPVLEIKDFNVDFWVDGVWYPGLFIISIALSINFIGDGLRDAFDPRQRRRISKKERQDSATAKKLAQAND